MGLHVIIKDSQDHRPILSSRKRYLPPKESLTQFLNRTYSVSVAKGQDFLEIEPHTVQSVFDRVIIVQTLTSKAER